MCSMHKFNFSDDPKIVCIRKYLLLFNYIKFHLFIFTYVNQAHGIISWLVLWLREHARKENLGTFEIYQEWVADNHLPLIITVDCSVNVFTKLLNDNTLKYS